MNFEVKDFLSLHKALDDFCEFLTHAGIAEESVFDSRLIVSELATNVLKHARATAFIEGGIFNGKIEVEIFSNAKFNAPEKSVLPDETAEHGRGLYLVDKIGESRSTTPKGGIRVVVRTQYKK
ncbi:MAG: ATP-binding protein [Clostridia bacterium]|nr:ATP-binding protein [Clostridia bacterium]